MTRILFMDDQIYVRDALKIALSLKGYEVVTVNDGKAGLDEFKKSRFDLVIVDIYMPRLDGVKVIRQLRASRPDLPIIAVSGVPLGQSDRTTLDFLPKAGFKDVACLKKPFKAAELIEAVEKAIGLAKQPAQTERV